MNTTFVEQIELPKTLNLPKDVTFGVEIEFENAKLDYVDKKLINAQTRKLLDSKWKLKQDDSLYMYKGNKDMGGELISPVLIDEENTYKQIRNACHIIKSLGGTITQRCGGHIHVGSNLLEDDIKNYLRLARLWTVFEDEIIRFGFGEDELSRETMSFYAKSSAALLRHIELIEKEKYGKCDFNNFVRCYGFDKKLALSFFYLNEDKPFHTLEVRCPNGTLNPIIWKNNINFFTKLFISCKNKEKDWNMIERMFQKEKNNNVPSGYNIDKANLLANFVFDDEQDINNFMLQYKKDRNKILVKRVLCQIVLVNNKFDK